MQLGQLGVQSGGLEDLGAPGRQHGAADKGTHGDPVGDLKRAVGAEYPLALAALVQLPQLGNGAVSAVGNGRVRQPPRASCSVRATSSGRAANRSAKPTRTLRM